MPVGRSCGLQSLLVLSDITVLVCLRENKSFQLSCSCVFVYGPCMWMLKRFLKVFNLVAVGEVGDFTSRGYFSVFSWSAALSIVASTAFSLDTTSEVLPCFSGCAVGRELVAAVLQFYIQFYHQNKPGCDRHSSSPFFSRKERKTCPSKLKIHNKWFIETFFKVAYELSSVVSGLIWFAAWNLS